MSKSYWLKDDEQKGNFSNEKQDTFDPAKGYIGVRLQQGVPLLDRDWNELEDIRRYEDVMLRKHYIGNGSPDNGFNISATAPPSNDFKILAGRCIVDGFEVENNTEILYSDQQDVPALTTPAANRTDTVYLDVWIKEVNKDEDSDLGNPDDVKMETCIRHKIEWRVRVDEGGVGHTPPDKHYYYDIARISWSGGNITGIKNLIAPLMPLSLVKKELLNLRMHKVPLLRQTILGKAKRTETVPVGASPNAIAFDGTHIWVANSGSNNVSKIDINTNAVVGTVSVGTYPYGIAFDGTHIWVANLGSNNVSKIDININAVVATVLLIVGLNPSAIAFDGTHIWVANLGSNNVTKIDINTNAVVGPFSVGTYPYGIAFDGTHIWVANWGSNNVSKIDININAVVATVLLIVGFNPSAIAFDGTHIWVANWGSNNVSKININTNAVVGTVSVGTYPYGIAFDGTHIWVANSESNNITKIYN